MSDNDVDDLPYDFVDLLEYSIFAGQNLSTGLSGKMELAGRSMYERDIFHDAFIAKSHHHEKNYLGSDFLAPHHQDIYKDPNLIMFLKVLPQVEFQFQFKLVDCPMLSAAKKLKLIK